MGDDLVKRLRNLSCNCYDAEVIEAGKDAMDEAADRIEKLVAELHHCFHRIEELQAALRTIYDCCDETGNCSVVRCMARKALEGKDD